MTKPYHYEDACEVLDHILHDLLVLNGAKERPADWQDYAGTVAGNLRVLAGMLDAARADTNPLFPNIHESLARVEVGT